MYKFILIISFLLFLAPNVSAVDSSWNCPLDENGKIDKSQFLSGTKICFAPALSFTVTYESLALCTTDPEVELRAGRELDDVCHFLLRTTDSPIVLTMTNTASNSFAATLPGVGTYTHAMIITKNEYTVQGEVEFNGPIFGTNDGRDAVGYGNFCGVPSGDYKISTLYEEVLSGASLLAACYGVSKETPEIGTLTVDSLDSRFFDADVTGFGLLLDVSGEVATNEASVKSYVQSYPFPSPFTVSASTTGLTYGLSNDQAFRLITAGSGGGNVIAYLAYLGDFNFKVTAN
tara:strand:- start:1320 stop:2186 length:867 start_codon:yes stop_codon:yes gene_type:complete